MDIVDEIIRETEEIEDDMDAVVRAWEMKLEFVKTASDKEIKQAINCGIFMGGTCRFCGIYHEYKCRECPVYEDTGIEGCHETHWDSVAVNATMFRNAKLEMLSRRKKLIKSVGDELNYLKELKTKIKKDGV